jgi:hypothetical protein
VIRRVMSAPGLCAALAWRSMRSTRGSDVLMWPRYEVASSPGR